MPNENEQISPALRAAQAAEQEVQDCLAARQSFLLEAGAGAGKTYSLIKVLKTLLSSEGQRLRRNGQQIACITYTNVATDVIGSRIDNDKLVFVGTIHMWCWNLIKSYQPTLRQLLPSIEKWQEILAQGGELGELPVEYSLGYRKITDEAIMIHHDDVLTLTAELIALPKFQAVLASKFPYLLIDEYQDTNAVIMEAIRIHLLPREQGPLVGLFGDHWQKIYDGTCGQVADARLREIGKRANFRSAASIVGMLNRMRPALPQEVDDTTRHGSIAVFHTNGFRGQRRSGSGGHWTGDLPEADARRAFQQCQEYLAQHGWDFDAQKTKVLMLTHKVLANEQGYPNIQRVLPYNDLFVKKEDPYIKFFSERLEAACRAFQNKKFGEMFAVLGETSPRMSSSADKKRWAATMEQILNLRETGTIGDVLDLIIESVIPNLPDDVMKRERDAAGWEQPSDDATPELISRTRSLRAVRYTEMIALNTFLEGHSPFSTKHGV